MPEKKTTKKLWQKKNTIGIDPFLEQYNAGDDIIYDQELIPYDVQGSYAYGKMLQRHGIITKPELETLKKGLDKIMHLYNTGNFTLKLEDEDCHTKIENYLTGHFGDIGKKIHTARSRNDQILITMRLFMKEKLQHLKKASKNLASELLKTAQKYEFTPFPGYTHMQKAMPTSLGTWYGAFAESLMDDIRLLQSVSDELIDQNPLGTGAGYGTPFDFDRDQLTKDLNMKRTQNNPIYCQNSRGKLEGLVLEVCSQFMLTLNKLATDLLLYTTQEYNFFTIPDNVATGSSIMPQKKNLDAAELMRGRTATVLACKNELVMNGLNRVSGYQRDGQEIKRPLFLGLRYTEISLQAASILINSIEPNEEVILNDMTPELFAAHKAFELVKKGKTFRDAYVEVGKNLHKLKINKSSIQKMLKESRHQGGVGNLNLKKLMNELTEL